MELSVMQYRKEKPIIIIIILIIIIMIIIIIIKHLFTSPIKCARSSITKTDNTYSCFHSEQQAALFSYPSVKLSWLVRYDEIRLNSINV